MENSQHKATATKLAHKIRDISMRLAHAVEHGDPGVHELMHELHAAHNDMEAHLHHTK